MLLQILILLDRTGGSSKKCLQVLRKICGLRKVLPTTYELPKNVSPIGELPSAFGGFCDAYEGTLNAKVCIKKLRISATGDREKVKEVPIYPRNLLSNRHFLTNLKLFCKEAVVWKRLNHPNIVPFRGVTFDPLQLVSEWMTGGELREYVKKNQDINLISLVGPFLPTSARYLILPLSHLVLPKVLLIFTHEV